MNKDIFSNFRILISNRTNVIPAEMFYQATQFLDISMLTAGHITHLHISDIVTFETDITDT